MKCQVRWGAGVITMLLCIGTGIADEGGGPARVVDGFFDAYATFHPSDGIPDAQGRARYEPFISPGLDTLLIEANKAEEAFAKANKNSPPLIEGDLFTSNFEGATSRKILGCKQDAKAATCTVALVYSDGKDKPVEWHDTIYLLATASGWRVDDIGYGANWPFANKGRLTETLKSTIQNASE